MFVRQEINNLRWANLTQTFILGLLCVETTVKETKACYLEKSSLRLLMFTKLKERLESFFCRGKTSEKDFAGESWMHTPVGTENTWIWSHLFLLLPDIRACLKNTTLPGIAKKTNVVINFSKDSTGEAAAQAMQWLIMRPSGWSGSPWGLSDEGRAFWEMQSGGASGKCTLGSSWTVGWSFPTCLVRLQHCQSQMFTNHKESLRKAWDWLKT